MNMMLSVRDDYSDLHFSLIEFRCNLSSPLFLGFFFSELLMCDGQVMVFRVLNLSSSVHIYIPCISLPVINRPRYTTNSQTSEFNWDFFLFFFNHAKFLCPSFTGVVAKVKAIHDKIKCFYWTHNRLHISFFLRKHSENRLYADCLKGTLGMRKAKLKPLKEPIETKLKRVMQVRCTWLV